MRAAYFAVVIALGLLGCSHMDPIDRVTDEVHHGFVPSYTFAPIDLPQTATPAELISAIFKRSAWESGLFDFTSYKILQIRSVPAEFPSLPNYTAVLLDTNLGQKVVLLQPLQEKSRWHGWYYKIYEPNNLPTTTPEPI
jgi:hypothetical protein